MAYLDIQDDEIELMVLQVPGNASMLAASMALQASDWTRLVEALEALERFQKAWPTLVERLRDAPISIAEATLAVPMEAYGICGRVRPSDGTR